MAGYIGNAQSVVVTDSVNTDTFNTLNSEVDANTSAIASLPTPLGVDQTWQDMTASRASSVWYTNDTGRPIVVSVWAQNTSNYAYTWGGVGGSASPKYLTETFLDNYRHGTERAASVFIVPAGEEYAAYVSPSIGAWYELR